MPEPAGQSAKPRRARRWALLSGGALVLLLAGLAYHARLAANKTEETGQSRNVSYVPQPLGYVPEDLDDCFTQLKSHLEPQAIEKMKSGTEADMSLYHFSVGMWMRNNWGLWGGSRLARWFNAQGIKHPDDMSGIILTSFWRHLHGKPIKLEEQVKFYQDYWEKQKAAER